jgi:hypothetical protein
LDGGFSAPLKCPLAQLARAPALCRKIFQRPQFQIGTHESHCAPPKEKANYLMNILLFKNRLFFAFVSRMGQWPKGHCPLGHCTYATFGRCPNT